MSHRIIPPNIFTRIPLTLGSSRIMLNAVVTWSSLAPPPTSRKLAGSPPYNLITSMVAIAKPAPFTMQPISPSSFTYERPVSFALTSISSSSERSLIFSHSGCLNNALSSNETLASRATMLPLSVLTRGLISIMLQSESMNKDPRFTTKSENEVQDSPTRPRADPSSEHCKCVNPFLPSLHILWIASGSFSATSSISTPPCSDAMTSNEFAPRSTSIAR